MLNRFYYLRFLLVGIFSCLLTLLVAQEANLAKANQLMVEKKYKEAALSYEGLLDQGYTGEELHYNIGNAWYRAGNIGKAILNYERALHLDAGHQATKINLKIAQERLQDDIIELEPFFLYEWWLVLIGVLPSSIWMILGLLLLWGASYFGYRYLYAPKRDERKKGFIQGLSLVLVALLILFIAFQKQKREVDSGAAIILASEVPLCSAPNDPETAVQTLHAGTKVYLVDKIGVWQLVRLGNGDQGWMEETAIEKI